MTNVKEKKTNRFTANVAVIIVAVVFGVIATFIAHAQSILESGAVKVLLSIGIGLTTSCFALALGYLVIGLVFNYKFAYVVASIGLFFGTLFLLVVCMVKFWAIIIIMVALALVLFLCFFLVYRKKLVLVADNEKPDYKDYKTRKAEEDLVKANQKEEELPEIKSFK